MTPAQPPQTPDFLAFEEDLNRRMRRFLVAMLLMLVASGAALSHLASMLQARSRVARGHARQP